MSTQIFQQQVWPLRDRLYRMAFRLLGERAEAEDVVQEVMIKLWERREELPNIQNVEGWCVRIVRNHGIDRYRSRKRRSSTGLEQAAELADQAPDPALQLQTSDMQERIHRLIQGLPEQRRLVLQLREIEGLSYREIAEQLRITLDQVRTDIHRGRQALRAALVKNPIHE